MCSGIGAFVNDVGLCSCGNGALLSIIDNNLQCVCQAGFISFDDSCVACAGTGARLDVNGVCQCADFATFIENAADGTAVCQCNTNYLPFNDVCVMCSGVGAYVNDAGICSCGTGAYLGVIDSLVQCVCPVTWVQSGDACFQCDDGKIFRLTHLLRGLRFTC